MRRHAWLACALACGCAWGATSDAWDCATLATNAAKVADWMLAHPPRGNHKDWTYGAFYAGVTALGLSAPSSRAATRATHDLGSGCTAEELAAILCSKKVEHAYALAGGLTAELVFDGQVYAPSGDTAEVPVSDILYFATALPYKGVAKK